ncbi:hypothetical protein Tco_0568773 [Tanacetum coccineum]
MYIPYITISLDSDDESTKSSNTVLIPPSHDYVSASPDYVPTLELNTKPFEGPILYDYIPRLDTKTEPSEQDLEESSKEFSTEEDPSK